jgi:hypothetical protein
MIFVYLIGQGQDTEYYVCIYDFARFNADYFVFAYLIGLVKTDFDRWLPDWPGSSQVTNYDVWLPDWQVATYLTGLKK